MSVRFLLCITSLALALSGTAHAARSLEQVRYALFQNDQAAVEGDLRELVARGDLPAARLLGEVLAGRNSSNIKQAIALFKQAFADGRGDISALIPLARLLDNKPRWHAANRAYLRQALGRFAPGRDFTTVNTNLEVFLVYPELFSQAEATQLIELYERACLIRCHAALYRAVLAAHQGEQAAAEKWFKLAVMTDPRAVDRYYRFLGEQRNLLFRNFAKGLVANMDSLPVDLVQHIGQTLIQIRNNEISIFSGKRPQTRAKTDEEKQAREQQQEVYAGLIEQLDREVLQWLDNAIERDFGPAMLSKANFLMTAPDRYSPEPVLALIQRLEERQGQRLSAIEREQPVSQQAVKALRASFYMVLWPTLNPRLSQSLTAELQAEGYPEARLLEADLYSLGGLDEPDQERALALYMQEARQGSVGAMLRIARLYVYGRAICRDDHKAYSFAYAAHELGAGSATELMRTIGARLTPQERDTATVEGNRLIEESTL